MIPASGRKVLFRERYNVNARADGLMPLELSVVHLVEDDRGGEAIGSGCFCQD
jgi:hypothetical protein